MHVSLPVSKETVFMGSDTDGEWFGHGFKEGNNFSISIYTDHKDEADRLFQQLSNGGQVKVSMQILSGASILVCSRISLGLIG